MADVGWVDGEPTLPFVVTLPPGWNEVDPAASGVPEATIAAVRVDAVGESFSPNILLAFDTVELPIDPEAAAADSLSRLRDKVASAEVVEHNTFDESGSPGVAQVVRLHLDGRGTAGVDLMQSSVFLAVPTTGSSNGLLVEMTATTTQAQLGLVAPEFQQFVASFRLRHEPGVDASAGASPDPGGVR